MRRKIIKAAVLFFIIMTALTVLSRVAYNISTPKVTVGTPAEMTLGPEVIAGGIVEASREVPVATVGQQVVQTVSVRSGQEVQMGDILFELDMKKLEEEIEVKQNELLRIDLQIQSLESAHEAEWESRMLVQEQAWEDYEKALASEDEEMIAMAKRALNQANLPVAEDTSIDQMNLERQKVDKELQTLLSLKETEGKITAPVEGVVSEVNVKAGSVTSGLADVLIIDGTSDMVVKAQFPAEYKAYVVRGASVMLMSNEKTLKEKIHAVGESVDGSGNIEAIVELSEDSFRVGTPLTMQVVAAKKTYPVCIPLEALHQGERGFYVHVLDTRETMLGEEIVAVQQEVEIDYKGEGYVSLEHFWEDQKVILSADREIENGGHVKPLNR